jgi:dTDP-4-dehydrorhamnose 3,5-epimerase
MDKNLINGIKIKSLNEFKDNRGSLLHMLRSDDEDFISFGECYFSEIVPGAIKGWKKHILQIQNISVPIGIVKFVFYDDRKTSSTKAHINEIIVGRPNNYSRITIPNNIWYSFSCISPQTALIVNCSTIPHDKNESVSIDINSNIIPYLWHQLIK